MLQFHVRESELGLKGKVSEHAIKITRSIFSFFLEGFLLLLSLPCWALSLSMPAAFISDNWLFQPPPPGPKAPGIEQIAHPLWTKEYSPAPSIWASGISDTYRVQALNHLAENKILCDTCWHSGLGPLAPWEHALDLRIVIFYAVPRDIVSGLCQWKKTWFIRLVKIKANNKTKSEPKVSGLRNPRALKKEKKKQTNVRKDFFQLHLPRKWHPAFR